VSREFDSYLQEHGIKRELSCAHTPQQNGVSERKNRHLVESCWAPCYRPREFRGFIGANALGLQPIFITKLRLRQFPTRRYMRCYTRRYQMLGTCKYLAVSVMFTCLNRPKGSWTRRRSNACSLDTPLRGKGGGVLSLRQEGCTSPVTSCSTKEPVGVGSQQREGTYINQQPQFDRNVGGRTAKGNGRRSFRNHVRRGCDALLIYTGRRCYDVMPSSSSASAQQSSSHTQGDRERGPWRTGVHVEGAERPVPRTCEERQKKTGVVQEAAPQGSSTSRWSQQGETSLRICGRINLTDMKKRWIHCHHLRVE
jgi:hypothetical protein